VLQVTSGRISGRERRLRRHTFIHTHLTHFHTHTPLAEDTAGMLAYAVRFSLLTLVACAAAVEEEAGGAGFAVWALRLVLRFTCLFWVSLCVLSFFLKCCIVSAVARVAFHLLVLVAVVYVEFFVILYCWWWGSRCTSFVLGVVELVVI